MSEVALQHIYSGKVRDLEGGGVGAEDGSGLNNLAELLVKRYLDI